MTRFYKLFYVNKRVTAVLCVVLIFALALGLCRSPRAVDAAVEQSFIRYAEFNVTYPALCRALEYDIASREQEIYISWIDVLAYLGAKYGGDFSRYKAGDMDSLIYKLQNGETLEELTGKMTYYSYYRKVYGAVLGGLVGFFSEDGGPRQYGLKAFSPLAYGFDYTDYDDFGAARTYGYRREHLGHDMLALTGTPVIAVESGTVEALGWNQYGGWRIGIRSDDGQRYYYYAHLRKDRPYAQDLQQGDRVTAGDVIGYVGRTGYSATPNTNNITQSHLHIGLELVFDESQKESDNEIWVNLYPLVRLLQQHRCQTVRDEQTKEYTRKYAFAEY